MRRPVTLRVTVPALVAGSILATLVSVASGAGPGDQADALRRQNGSLVSQSQGVVLELYGLDSRLAAARTRLASVAAQSADVRRDRTTVAKGLTIARRATQVSQRALGSRLRELYENGDTDPLAILLGAGSLDEAVTRLDDLQSLAEQDRTVLQNTRSATKRMQKLSRTLATHEAELAELESQSEATVAQLSSARAARSAYLAQLAAQRSLNAGRISALEAQAQEVARKAAEIQAATPAPSASTPAPIALAAPVAPLAHGPTGNTITVLATGYALPGHTATGAPVGYGVVAVDPSVIPLGTTMSIPGYGEGTAADVGSGISGAMIDLWFPTAQQALGWGRRTVTITLHQ